MSRRRGGWVRLELNRPSRKRHRELASFVLRVCKFLRARQKHILGKEPGRVLQRAFRYVRRGWKRRKKARKVKEKRKFSFRTAKKFQSLAIQLTNRKVIQRTLFIVHQVHLFDRLIARMCGISLLLNRNVLSNSGRIRESVRAQLTVSGVVHSAERRS